MLFAPPGVGAVHGMPHERPVHHGDDPVADALSPFLGRRRTVTMGLWTRSNGRPAPLRTREDTPRTPTLPTRRWPAWRRYCHTTATASSEWTRRAGFAHSCCRGTASTASQAGWPTTKPVSEMSTATPNWRGAVSRRGSSGEAPGNLPAHAYTTYCNRPGSGPSFVSHSAPTGAGGARSRCSVRVPCAPSAPTTLSWPHGLHLP